MQKTVESGGKQREVEMAEAEYLDFDLFVAHLEGRYHVRVLDSPAGQASAEFTLPFSPLEIENFWLRLGRPQRGMRGLESTEVETAKDFGGRLFRAVFTDAVRDCFLSSLNEASQQEAGLRIRLRLTDAPELIDMPWEYLYNPDFRRFYSLSEYTPLVRYLDLPERTRPLAVKPPLRVLAMISSPQGYPPLDVEGEWAKLKEAMGDLEQQGLVSLERLGTATLTALLRQLPQEEYHVFHFVGHGAFDPQAQEGILLMEDDVDQGSRVSGWCLGMLLHDERTLRLAILNACEGARTASSDPFSGIAQSLVQQGVPAVIAMQSQISDKAAITLAHEFYSALACGYPVDAALAEARKTIFGQGNGVEWGVPVLYMRTLDGRLFDIDQDTLAQIKAARKKAPASPDLAAKDQAADRFSTPQAASESAFSDGETSPFVAGPPTTHPRLFFGRREDLKRLFALWKRPPLQNAAIIGPRRSGKTSLLLYLKSITTTPAEQLRPGQYTDWLPEPQRYRWIYVDFQDSRLGRLEGLLRFLLDGLGLPLPDPCDLDHFMDVTSQQLRTPTVILLDEIGVALQRYPELDDAFWESMRALTAHLTQGNLAFVLAAHESPNQLAQHSGFGSPFFNIFAYTKTLGPLEQPEAQELIASSPIPFPPADVEWILAQSGCWPILLQLLCRERLFALEEGEAGDAWREEALRQLVPFQDLLKAAP
jgi:CHAT domain